MLEVNDDNRNVVLILSLIVLFSARDSAAAPMFVRPFALPIVYVFDDTWYVPERPNYAMEVPSPSRRF